MQLHHMHFYGFSISSKYSPLNFRSFLDSDVDSHVVTVALVPRLPAGLYNIHESWDDQGALGWVYYRLLLLCARGQVNIIIIYFCTCYAKPRPCMSYTWSKWTRLPIFFSRLIFVHLVRVWEKEPGDEAIIKKYHCKLQSLLDLVW